jgi:CubicO group peptidase (beta-lactamase class C family)
MHQGIELNRRALLAGFGLVAGYAATPAFAKKMAKAKGQWPAVQAVLDEWVAKKIVPGAVSIVGRGTSAPEIRQSGVGTFGEKAAVGADSIFRAYSMSKPVTGMAAMLLIEDGKLKLDQNIADFIPGFANMRVLTDPANSLASRPANGGITVRHLMTHTAGLGYNIITKGPLLDEYIRLGLSGGQVSKKALPGFPGVTHAPSLKELGDRLATLPLISDPGAQWSYSIALDLLGRVIEVASGMPFEDFLSARIFKPLAMDSTGFQVAAKDVNRFTTNHFQLGDVGFPIDGAKESIYLDKPPFPMGGGGLVCSARDYDRFLAMLLGDGALGKVRIMKPETAQLGMSNLMPEGRIIDSGFAKGYGFGAGGRVTVATGPNGEGKGTFGWAGAASTVGWVDRGNNLRASGWVQLMTRGDQKFLVDFAKAVYGQKSA